MAEKEYIRKVEVVNHLQKIQKDKFTDSDYKKFVWAMEIFIDGLPTADVQPIRHGHWVSEYDCGYITPHCSECGEIALTKEETSYDYVYSSYCPRCGAKMRTE